jgi:hypothetical protein
MVQVSPGATTIITMEEATSGAIKDDKDKPIKFEQVKDTNPPRFEGKDSDGNTYGFETGGALVSVTRNARVDLKALRKQSKGFPIPKEEAQKLDEEIAKETAEKAEGEEKQETQSQLLQKEEQQQKQVPPAATATTKKVR